MSSFDGMTIRFRGKAKLDLNLTYEYGCGKQLVNPPDWKTLKVEYRLSRSQIRNAKRKIRRFLNDVSEVSSQSLWGH